MRRGRGRQDSGWRLAFSFPTRCGMVLLTETGGVHGGEGWKGFFVSHVKFQVLLRCEDRAVRGAEEAKSGFLGRD